MPIVIPNDRTTKQRARGYCLNPQCFVSSEDSRFEFSVEHDRFCCPKCGANTAPLVGLLVLTHWLLPAADGPLVGHMGMRYRLACDSRRAYMATRTNLEATTSELAQVTCEGCKLASQWFQKQSTGFRIK